MTVGLSNGPFDNMKFEPYAFKEYPKKITVGGGKRVTVNNSREEIAAIAEFGAGPVQATNDPITEERNALAQANSVLAAKLAEAEKKLAEHKGAEIVNQTPGAPPPAKPAQGASVAGNNVAAAAATPQQTKNSLVAG